MNKNTKKLKPNLSAAAPIQKPPVKDNNKQSVEDRDHTPFPKKETSTNQIENSSENPIYKKAFWALAGLALLMMWIMSFSYGISGDEQDMAEYGKAALRFYTSFGNDVSAFSLELDRDGVFKYYGAWFDVTAAILNKILPFWEYDTRHLLNATVGWAAMVFVGRTAQLLMNWRSAIIAFMLIFFSPIFFGHAMNNPKDIPFAMGMMMGVYYILKLLKNLPNPDKKTVFFACLGIGLAIGSRIGGLLLFGYVGLFFGIEWLRNKDKISFGTYFKYGLILGLGGFAFGTLFFPYGLQSPIAHTIETFKQVAQFPIAIKETFRGEFMLSHKLPLSYLPTMILISTPIFILVSALLSLGVLPKTKKRTDIIYLGYVLFASLFPLGYILATDANVYGGWRHILFFYPPLIVFIAIGLDTLIDLFRNSKIFTNIAYAMLLVFSFSIMFWYAKSHPNQYVYYNALVGGTSKAAGNYELDYYYNSIRETAQWFRTNVLDKLPKDKKIILCTNAHKQVQFYFKDDTRVEIVYSNYYNKTMKNWDYGLFAAKGVNPLHIRNKTFPNGGEKSILFRNELEGSTLSYVCSNLSSAAYESYVALNQMDAVLAKEKALEYMQVADSTDPSVINYLANAEFILKNYDEALKLADRALALHPAHTGALGVVAQVYVEQKGYEKAITFLEQLIEEDPNLAWPHYYMAVSLFNQAKGCDASHKAIAHIDHCLQMQPSFLEAYKIGSTIAQRCNMQDKYNYYQQQLRKIQ